MRVRLRVRVRVRVLARMLIVLVRGRLGNLGGRFFRVSMVVIAVAVAIIGAVVMVVVPLHDRWRENLWVDACATLIDRLSAEEGGSDQEHAGQKPTREGKRRGGPPPAAPPREGDP